MNRQISLQIAVGVVGFIFLLFATCGWRVIGPEYVAVKVTAGEVSKEVCYGFSTKLPLFGSFVKLDKTTQRVDNVDATYTKDLQPAQVKYVFTYRIVDANASALYLAAGKSYQEKLIIPKLTSTVKDVIGRWGAQELIDNRANVQTEIMNTLKEDLPEEFFTDISFELGDVDYSDEFEKGIEAKVLAEQKAQEAKNKTVQIQEEARQQLIITEANAQAKILEAEGSAKAMDKEGAAIRRNPEVLKLKGIEAQLAFAKSAASWENVVLGNTSGTLLNMPFAGK